MRTLTCIARAQGWALTPRLPLVMDPIEGMLEALIPRGGTRMAGVVPQSSTPTGGTEFEIEVSILAV